MSKNRGLPLSGRRLSLLILVVFLLSQILTSGCSSSSYAEARAAVAAKGQDDLVIGVAWPFASNGGMLSEGVDLAMKEINTSGGVNGRQIRVIKQDDDGSVTKGMAIAQSFAENSQMVAVIGHRNSSVSIPAAAIYEKASLIMLTPASTAPELTHKGYQYIFRCIPNDTEIARQLAVYAAKNGHRRMAVYYVDDSYGRGLANAFADYAGQSGITIVDRVSYYGDFNDMTRLYHKWSALDYDGVFLAQSLMQGSEFISDARKAGISVPFFTGNAMDSAEISKIAGLAAEGTVVGTIFNPLDSRPETQRFVRAFRDTYKQEPTQYAAQGYDAVKLLAQVIKDTGSTDPVRMASQFHNLKNWSGVSGSHSFGLDGDEQGNLVVKKIVRNGKLEVLSGNSI